MSDLSRFAQLPSQREIEAELTRRRSPRVTLFPDSGPCRRDLYRKHLEFFSAGIYKERLFMAANRVGKTVAGAYETACHLTGRYPSWWEGKRFDRPSDGWACGASSQTTRDVVQGALLGKTTGMGMLLPEDIVQTTAGRGVTGSIETVRVRHVSGKISKLGFKTYEQGRRAFEGEAKDFVWCDEEPPMDVYTEILYRLLTTGGLAYTTFTPLMGRSEVVNSFLEITDEQRREQSKYLVQAGWDDVPHLDEDEKRRLLATTPAYQVQARTKGEPTLGKGAIYPFPEEQIAIDPFSIPEFWPRAYGLDVGWERTACIWGAMDPGTTTVYLYDEYYEPGGPHNAPRNHSAAIRARGDWIPGVVDPASAYHQLQPFDNIGLNLAHAENNVEQGILAVFELLATGRLKVFRSCTNWFAEFRKYQRTETFPNRPLKRDDHLMDATRYLVVSGRQRMTTAPPREGIRPQQWPGGPNAWMLM